MKGNGCAWWHARIDYALTLFDILRIDHFRGFDRFTRSPRGGGREGGRMAEGTGRGAVRGQGKAVPSSRRTWGS
ncbi:MAG: 4-alpha-glucanotransferase [Christensenellaceae bacterium]